MRLSLLSILVLCSGVTFAADTGIDLPTVTVPAVAEKVITPRRITRRVTIEWSDDTSVDPVITVNRTTVLLDEKGKPTTDVPTIVSKSDYPDDTYALTAEQLKMVAPEFTNQVQIFKTATDKLDAVKRAEADAKKKTPPTPPK